MGQLVDRGKRIRLHLPVVVRGLDLKGAHFTETTRTLNISGGGILLESQRRVSVGTKLDLAIDVPFALRRHFGGQARYETKAVVCRVELTGDGTISKVGARFLAGS
jgi:hypothetical protein